MAEQDPNFTQYIDGAIEARNNLNRRLISKMTSKAKDALLYKLSQIHPEFLALVKDVGERNDNDCPKSTMEFETKRNDVDPIAADVISTVTSTDGSTSSPSFCVCRKCQLMPSAVENRCCGNNDCLTTAPEFRLLCLQPFILVLFMRFRRELLMDEGDNILANDHFRFSAYCNLCLWLYKRFGAGKKLVFPACAVLSIRARFPDPQGFYESFVPGRYPA